jgi:hypothetical protein
MPEVKNSLTETVRYVDPHSGRNHAAIIIKVLANDSVVLHHWDPESGLGQTRTGVVYSFEPIANTFHWKDDDNQPKTEEEAAAQTLSRVSSAQNRTGAPPTASANVPPAPPDPSQSEPDPPDVPHTSVELEQASAPVVQPVAATIPEGNPAEPTTEVPDETPPPDPPLPQDETVKQDETSAKKSRWSRG